MKSLLWLGLVSLAGCQAPVLSEVDHGTTEGDLGRASFFWLGGGGPDCGFCRLSRPIMVGTMAEIAINAERMPRLTVVSDRPEAIAIAREVAGWSCSSPYETTEQACEDAGAVITRNLSFWVEAHEVDDVPVELRTEDGELWDRVTVSARREGAIELWRGVSHRYRADDWRPASELVLSLYGPARNNGGAESEAPLWARVLDEDGQWLEAPLPRMTIEDPSIADFGQPGEGTLAEHAYYIAIYPRALGTTTLHLELGSAVTDVPVRVE